MRSDGRDEANILRHVRRPDSLQRLAAGGLLRLLENVLAVGEDPDNLIVYAALGRAARDWPSHDRIVETLKTIRDGETLIVQSGKPIGVIRTHPKAPVVIMANCNIVGSLGDGREVLPTRREESASAGAGSRPATGNTSARKA